MSTDTPTIDKTNTPDEIIDLVNEHDEVIGQTTKGEANGNPTIIHREIAVLIYDESNRILFQQRSRKKTVGPLSWDLSVAGHIPSGTSIEEAAHLELQEELGFDVSLEFAVKKLRKYDNETHFASYFIGQYDNSPIMFEQEEVEQTKFMNKIELQRFMTEGNKVGDAAIDIAGWFWSSARPS